MLLKNKVTVTVTNNGEDENFVKVDTLATDKVMEVLTALRMASKDIERQLVEFLGKNRDRQDKIEEVKMMEIYGIDLTR